MAQYMLEVSYLQKPCFANELKTIVACSALAVARFVLIEEPWPATLEEATGVTNYHLFECSRDMFSVVSEYQNKVLSPVNLKYCTPHVREKNILDYLN